ncbi:hypothetical protein FUA23_21350 [Neolewinella aurantiaca]|uniref:Uncharacterized protein n=1 Tax=Neolewinella aurantiaca TaxID=2602767 RepID=A0A5C7F5R5_9BACT|nr:hypothetical protein [Neolewinella aurantiaca]TXF84025.1 hypothetical protein FUA23_21350 [Neolewinella aurantiaca]
MEDRLLDKIAQPFNLNLPEHETMEQAIDEFLPAVRGFGFKDLTDENAPLYKVDWVSMTDKPGATEVNLHTFLPSGEIRIARDGSMDGMSFNVLTSNRIIIGQSVHRDAFLYELQFMDEDFLIFKRHGNEANIKKKYLFYCREAIGTRLVWNEALEKMVDKYRNNQFPWIPVLVVLAIVVGVMLYFR